MNDADEIHVEANEGCGAHSETQTQPKQDHTTEPQRAPPPAILIPPFGRMRLGVEAAAAFSMLTKFTRANGLRVGTVERLD